MMSTWRDDVEYEMSQVNDPGPIIHVAPNEDVLDIEFDAGYGGPEGPWFLAWTETHVYFPVCYDGSETVSSAPRNPTDEGQGHVGGW